jgi:hypothetical protein
LGVTHSTIKWAKAKTVNKKSYVELYSTKDDGFLKQLNQ